MPEQPEKPQQFPSQQLPQQPEEQPQTKEGGMSFFKNNKGLIIAVVVGFVVLVVALISLTGRESASQYKGMLERIDQHTVQSQ